MWQPAPQDGRTIVVTGANAGLGFWTTLMLAQIGARVVMACRNRERADAAARAIRARVPAADLTFVRLDVSDLSSVTEAAQELVALDRLDVLIENAGIVHVPLSRQESVDGLELVAATNFFGHFALTAEVLPALERTPGSRVITLGSASTRLMRPRLDDLQSHRYLAPAAYAQSKIMLQAFGFELDRRLQAQGSAVRSVSTHPGYSISGRTPRVPGVNEPSRAKRFRDSLQAPIAQGKDQGALPIVRAALDPDAVVGDGPVYFGPRWMVKGAPVREIPAAVTTHPAVASAVWAEAERVTGRSLLS